MGAAEYAACADAVAQSLSAHYIPLGDLERILREKIMGLSGGTVRTGILSRGLLAAENERGRQSHSMHGPQFFLERCVSVSYLTDKFVK